MGEVIVIDELEPSWKIHSSFISEHLSRALDLDSLRSSHPIEMPCPDEATINQIFDAVSYSKGGSVLKVRLPSQRTSLPKSKLTSWPSRCVDVEQLCWSRQVPQGSVSSSLLIDPKGISAEAFSSPFSSVRPTSSVIYTAMLALPISSKVSLMCTARISLA